MLCALGGFAAVDVKPAQVDGEGFAGGSGLREGFGELG